MLLHLKIGSSGKKSLVKCSRTASIMSNFTTWHCVKDEMGKEGSIAQMFTTWHRYRKQNFTDRQVFKWSSVQVLKFIDKKKAQVLKCSSTASVLHDHFVIFPWSNKVTANKQDLTSLHLIRHQVSFSSSSFSSYFCLTPADMNKLLYVSPHLKVTI